MAKKKHQSFPYFEIPIPTCKRSMVISNKFDGNTFVESNVGFPGKYIYPVDADTASKCKIAGVCPAGWYQLYCLRPCGHCREPCDYQDGSCHCKPGSKDPSCKCFAGWHGRKCSIKCGHCSNINGCNSMNGNCYTGGCKPGWRGSGCNQPCLKGQYGHNCSQKCGHCFARTCNSISGICPSGKCKNGWKNYYCTEKCPNRWYGQKCLNRCGHCFNRQPCKKSNGECLSNICDPGWKGIKCTEKCPSGYYGMLCERKCMKCLFNEPCNHTNGLCPVILCNNGTEISYCNSIGAKLSPLHTSRLFAKNYSSMFDNLIIKPLISVVVACLSSLLLLFVYINRSVLRTWFAACFIQEVQLSSRRLPFPTFTDDEYNRLPGIHFCPNDLIHRNNVRIILEDNLAIPESDTHELKDSENPSIQRNPGITKYLNASCILGYNGKCKYIASAAPQSSEEIVDFWSMVWQMNSFKIVMLTCLQENRQVLCKKYWTERGIGYYGLISVEMVTNESFAECVVRTFSVGFENHERRTISQFHFQSWPIHYVPGISTELLVFRDKVYHLNPDESGGLLIVHGSEGIGRTGTFIALDYLLDMAEKCRKIDVKKCLMEIRNQRANLIENRIQYNFLHNILREAMLLSHSSYPVEHFTEILSKVNQEAPSDQTRVRYEFNLLQKSTYEINRGIYNYTELDAAAMIGRTQTCVCNPIPNSDCMERFILSSYFSKFFFLLITANEMYATENFWNIFIENGIQLIILVEDSSNHQMTDFLLSLKDRRCVKYGHFFVVRGGGHESGMLAMSELVLFVKKSVKHIIKVVHRNAMSDNNNAAESHNIILSLIYFVKEIHAKYSPKRLCIISNGYEKSALFCAVWNLTERAGRENVVNVMSTVKLLKFVQPDFINDHDQYELCYLMIEKFLNSRNNAHLYPEVQ